MLLYVRALECFNKGRFKVFGGGEGINGQLVFLRVFTVNLRKYILLNKVLIL